MSKAARPGSRSEDELTDAGPDSQVTRPDPRTRRPAMPVCRYKTLLSYLPGMATVVNSFTSPEVQKVVFDELYRALQVRMEQEGVPPAPKAASSESSRSLKSLLAQAPGPSSSSTELAHDILEGDSIHSLPPKG